MLVDKKYITYKWQPPKWTKEIADYYSNKILVDWCDIFKVKQCWNTETFRCDNVIEWISHGDKNVVGRRCGKDAIWWSPLIYAYCDECAGSWHKTYVYNDWQKIRLIDYYDKLFKKYA